MLLRRYAPLVATLLLLGPRVSSAEWQALTPAEPPEGNPLRGLMPYQASGGSQGFPHSLEYQYVAMKDVVTAPATFDWSVIDALLDDVASRGKQTVFRIYLDYPNCCPGGTYNTGVPAFLLTGAGAVTFFSYAEHGGGMSPDYDNERLLVAIEEMAAALGARYDGDPRLGFLQVGLVGMWGEWHTYPYDGFEQSPDLMPSLAGQARVLRAYGEALATTPLLVSQDSMDQFDASTPCGPSSICPADFSALGVGFHDDNFCVGTYDADDNLGWYFEPKLRARGLDELWRQQPIGGEIQPAIQDSIFTAGWNGQSYEEAVEAVHASFLLDQFAFETDGDADRVARTRAGASLLGYKLRVLEAQLRQTPPALSVSIRIVNVGVAPFYYAWPVEVAARSGAAVAGSWTPPWDLRTIMPGEPATEWTLDIASPGLAPGDYEIAMRVANPLSGGPPLGFANAESDGEWLTLGTITVSDGLVFADGFESGTTSAWH